MLDVAQLYADLSPHLAAYFWRRLAPTDRHLADDLVGDTFVRVLAHRDRYEDRDRARQYVWQIARNLLIDHRRRPASQVGHCQLDPDDHDPHDERADPERVVRRLWLDDAIRVATTPEQQRALAIRYYLGEPWAQAAARLGTTEAALKKLNARALASLKRHLEDAA